MTSLDFVALSAIYREHFPFEVHFLIWKLFSCFSALLSFLLFLFTRFEILFPRGQFPSPSRRRYTTRVQIILLTAPPTTFFSLYELLDAFFQSYKGALSSQKARVLVSNDTGLPRHFHFHSLARLRFLLDRVKKTLQLVHSAGSHFFQQCAYPVF